MSSKIYSPLFIRGKVFLIEDNPFFPASKWKSRKKKRKKARLSRRINRLVLQHKRP